MNLSDLFSRIALIVPAVEGWCSIDKACTLAATVIAYKPPLIVEIGVFAGRSLIPMALAAKVACPHSKVIGIDPWEATSSIEDMPDPHRDWWNKVNYAQMAKSFVDHLDHYRLDNVEIRAMRSDQTTIDEPIGILHIDGNHGPRASVYDVEHYAYKVQTGGYIFLDDIGWAAEAYDRLKTANMGLCFRELYKLESGAMFQRL